jgi:tRNA (guanine-N7-)-methyltransferase
METIRSSHGLLKEQEKREKRQQRLRSDYAEHFALMNDGLLEIGCGHGHWLTAYGQEHPEVYCVGVDLMNRRIQRSRNKAGRASLQQVHFIKAEAVEFLEILPESLALARVMVLFPDPWPKARHHRRRLIQPEFLSLLARRVKHGGQLCFRTDHDPYFEWAKERIASHPDWNLDPEPLWPFEHKTFFQEFHSHHQSLTATRA